MNIWFIMCVVPSLAEAEADGGPQPEIIPDIPVEMME